MQWLFGPVVPLWEQVYLGEKREHGKADPGIRRALEHSAVNPVEELFRNKYVRNASDRRNP